MNHEPPDTDVRLRVMDIPHLVFQAITGSPYTFSKSWVISPWPPVYNHIELRKDLGGGHSGEIKKIYIWKD